MVVSEICLRTLHLGEYRRGCVLALSNRRCRLPGGATTGLAGGEKGPVSGRRGKNPALSIPSKTPSRPIGISGWQVQISLPPVSNWTVRLFSDDVKRVTRLPTWGIYFAELPCSKRLSTPNNGMEVILLAGGIGTPSKARRPVRNEQSDSETESPSRCARSGPYRIRTHGRLRSRRRRCDYAWHRG